MSALEMAGQLEQQPGKHFTYHGLHAMLLSMPACMLIVFAHTLVEPCYSYQLFECSTLMFTS